MVMAEHAARQASVVEPIGSAWFASEDEGHSDGKSGEPEEEEVFGLSDMQWGGDTPWVEPEEEEVAPAPPPSLPAPA